MDYSKTIIYKIQHNTNPELVYVGHTIDFNTRKYMHKSNAKSHTKKLYQSIRENGGWECFTMVPIMEFPCETKVQACIQEEKCRVELKATLNMLKAHTTPEEKKEYVKKWQTENKEHIKEVRSKYKANNREEILEKNKVYYQNHKEERKAYRESIAEEQKEYKKEWYAKNKEKINADRMQTYTCSCGKDSLICNRVRHEKTKFHMENKK